MAKQKITLKISDMHCSNCALRLEGIEDDLDGVSSAKASYARQSMEVVYEDGKVSQAQILAAVKKLGYTASI